MPRCMLMPLDYVAEDYIAKYESLLTKTIRGAGIRTFFFGYTSMLDNYLTSQRQKIRTLQGEAHQERQNIYTSRNIALNSELVGLEVKVDMSKFNVSNPFAH